MFKVKSISAAVEMVKQVVRNIMEQHWNDHQLSAIGTAQNGNRRREQYND